MEHDFHELRDLEPELLIRYASGEPSLKDRATIRRWLAGDPARQGALDAFIRVWALAGENDLADTKGIWQRLDAAIESAEADRRIDNAPGSLRASAASEAISYRASLGLLRPLRGLAMTGAVAVCLGVLAVVVLRSGGMHASGTRDYATAAGERETVTLDDGTRFVLAPASRLRVPATYASGDRAVTLEGEAYFTVVHDAAHPFSVRAHRVVASDIGTAFDVRAYANDRDVRVAVSEGKVGVAAAPAGLGTVCDRPCATASTRVVVAGDVATVTDTVVSITHDVDVATITGWTTGVIAFDGVPLSDVLADLSRWYGVRIVAPDTVLAAHHVTLHLVNPALDPMLSGLADAVGARVERRGKDITLVPR